MKKSASSFLVLAFLAGIVSGGCSGSGSTPVQPVNKVTPTITWPTPSAITYGTALSATQLNATASVSGSFVYTPATGTTPTAGTQTLSVTFTPTDATNYNVATANVQIVVTPTTSTLVVRVVQTSPVWGQEPQFSWPDASPVKDAPGYSLYDVEIGRDANYVPIYVTLFKFTGWSADKFALTLSEYEDYRLASTITSIPIVSGGAVPFCGDDSSSSQVLVALKTITDVLFQREQPTRVVFDISGHGDPGFILEGGTMNVSDTVQFLKYFRNVAGGRTLILDFSMPCDEGFWDTVVLYYQYADYMIATDKPEGGYQSGPNFMAYAHDVNLSKYWQYANTTATALTETVTDEEGMWNDSSVSLVSLQLEQDVIVYNLAKFAPLVGALAQDKAFNPVTILPNYSNDVGTWVYATGDSGLITKYEEFRIYYASDRNLVVWQDDAKGFSVNNTAAFRDFLKSWQ